MKTKAPFTSPKRHIMEKLVEVCLLLLLYDEKGYGYGMIDRLPDFGFCGEELNVGSLYRTLRKMEQEELVSSSWEGGGQGPRRRVYRITGKGASDLHEWMDILKMRKQRIENLISRYEEKTAALAGVKK